MPHLNLFFHSWAVALQLGAVHKLQLQEVVEKNQHFVNVYNIENVNGRR